MILFGYDERKTIEQRIPDEWKKDVLSILCNGDLDFIEIRKTTALQPFFDMFPCAFSHDLLNAFIDGLDDADITGRQIHDMNEDGTTWVFIFTHQKKKILGKVCLTPDNELIIIYSAHAPRKGDKV